MNYKYLLTLTQNNTGQDTFTFYEEVDGENDLYLTSSVISLYDNVLLTTENEYSVFDISTPNENDDFTFTSQSIE